jgi:hypothetical protein
MVKDCFRVNISSLISFTGGEIVELSLNSHLGKRLD